MFIYMFSDRLEPKLKLKISPKRERGKYDGKWSAVRRKVIHTVNSYTTLSKTL
jgi:hypothetical protein